MTETSLGWHQLGPAMANELSPKCVLGTWSFPLSADLIPGRRSTLG